MGSIVRSTGYKVLHRPVELAGVIGIWPANTAQGCCAVGSLAYTFCDGLRPLIHGAVRLRQRKRRNLNIKFFGSLIDHLVGAMH